MSARPYLRPLAWIFGQIVARRNRAYDQGNRSIYKAPIPVISVGNISAGGTGKTPLASYLLTFIQAHYPHHRPAYLSRGYGRQTSGYLRVIPEQHLPMQVGDEALQVARQFPDLPVAVCEARRLGIQQLIQEAEATVIVLDDAFQHRAVARELDIVLIDAGSLPQADALLPEGYLREPLSSLDRADLVVINKLVDPGQIPDMQLAFQAWAEKLLFGRLLPQALQAASGETAPLTALQDKAVMLFAGIGRPEAFADVARAAGANVLETHWFADHHPYRNRELQQLRDRWRALQAEHPDLLLLTTEKDFSRLQGHMALPVLEQTALYTLPVGLAWWEGQERLADALEKHLKA